ncbi:uncharacterized protein L201_000738 [Kwoniella dendrophila CBS 6074]|uniref:Homeobox domain-containing protein n=1 Tax=Kwoniella dendrophila CBS 6074 TaxID=1295534 RepID=A0AAX4JKG9_9TREE
MSPIDSSLTFPLIKDEEGDSQLPQGGVDLQSANNMENSASAFWTNASVDNTIQPASTLPMTPAWSMGNLSNRSGPSQTGLNTPPIDNSSNRGNAINPAYTTSASVSDNISYPFSAKPSNIMFRPNNDLIQTPSTANTQWSSTTTSASTIDPSFMTSMPPPPPNTASQSITSPPIYSGIPGINGHHASHASFSGALTGLTPMLAGFTTSSPTFDNNVQNSLPNSTAPSPIGPQLTRPGGPIRTFSASAAIPQTSKKRSNTLISLASSSSTASSPSSFPYPSPRFPNLLMNTQPIIHPGNPVHPSPGQNRLNRQPSVPIMSGGDPTKRVFHPSPATAISPAIGLGLSHMPLDNDLFGNHRMGISMGYNSMPMGMGMGMRSAPPMEPKPPRFKPTKEQLDILIKSYEENKNPDGPAREALAKRLGSDVRPKTLQIWFQNRRSKSRAKERDANLPKPLHSRGGSASLGHRSSASASLSKSGNKNGANLDALRGLIHDDDLNLIILPISVLSIGNWTRFLMPGTGISHPDLAASLRFPPSAQSSLYMYVLHQTETFRIEIPVNPTSISNLQSVQNPSLNAEAVAISFELSMSTAKYAAWHQDEVDTGRWNEVGDFTGGETQGGGKCELTGDKEVLLSAFSKVQQYLSTQTFSHPIANAPPAISTRTAPWKYPQMSASATSVSGMDTPPFGLAPIIGHMQTHQRQRSSSQPDLQSSSSGGSGDSVSFSDSEFTSKALHFPHHDFDGSSGQVPLPTPPAYGDHSAQSLQWDSSLTAQNSISNQLQQWGFPTNSNTTNNSTSILNTSTSSTLDPSSLSTEKDINKYNPFATLNSGVTQNNQNNSGMNIDDNKILSGEFSEGSSDIDLGTPTYEAEGQMSTEDLATGMKSGEDRSLNALETAMIEA